MNKPERNSESPPRTILVRAWRWFSKAIDEQCPHCGYYCHGRSAFCTKWPGSSKEPGA